jgi:hypothetical protein
MATLRKMRPLSTPAGRERNAQSVHTPAHTSLLILSAIRT